MTPSGGNQEPRLEISGLLLRVGLFVLIALIAMNVFPLLLLPFGIFIAAALGTFAASATANAVAVRIYERGRMSSIGLDWAPSSRRDLLFGLGAGAGAALLVNGVPVLAGMATLEANPDAPFRLSSLLFVSIVLLFGAFGEELLFHGYAFQLLMKRLGPYQTILPAGVLFGLAHANNPAASQLGIANTMLWGVLFGYAYLRSGSLWLPIGLHYGWNWMLPLFGVNLSGFTMGVTGRRLRWSAGEIWSGGDYGPEASLLTTVAVAALLVLVRRLWVPPEERFE
jgi:uncharacterized protein